MVSTQSTIIEFSVPRSYSSGYVPPAIVTSLSDLISQLERRKDKFWARSVLRFIKSRLAPTQAKRKRSVSLSSKKKTSAPNTFLMPVEFEGLASQSCIYTELEKYLDIKSEHNLATIIYVFQVAFAVEELPTPKDIIKSHKATLKMKDIPDILEIRDFVGVFKRFILKSYKTVYFKQSQLEDTIIKMVINPKIYQNLMKKIQASLQMIEARYTENMQRFESIDTKAILLPDEYSLDNGRGYSQAIDLLKRINFLHSPIDKLQLIQEVSVCIVRALDEYTHIDKIHRELNGDITLEIFILLILRTKVNYLKSNIEYVRMFVHPDSLTRSEGYYLTTLEAALAVIINPPNNWYASDN